MPEMEKHVEVPEILREIPPEKFRQVVETLMGVGVPVWAPELREDRSTKRRSGRRGTERSNCSSRRSGSRAIRPGRARAPRGFTGSTSARPTIAG